MQLVLNQRGVHLKVNNGMFRVSYQKDIQDIPLNKVSSILLNPSVSLTSDVMFLAIENNIEIILVERTGRPLGRVWSNKYGSISKIRKNQVSFSKSADATEFIKQILVRKIENQQALIISLQTYDLTNAPEIEKTEQFLQNQIEKLKKVKNNTIEQVAPRIRGLEGMASKIYFETISKQLPAQYQFEKRSQHPAFDMFNAMLNYAYGMLYNHVERALIKAGIDPYLGIFHRDQYNRPVLVYDIIEQYRVWADYSVVELCMQQVMFLDFFDIENGQYFLNQYAKRVLIQMLNDYMEEVIIIAGLSRTRTNHIEFDMEQFAQKLKKWNESKDAPF